MESFPDFQNGFNADSCRAYQLADRILCESKYYPAFCSCKNTYEARKAMLVCVASSLPIWAFYMFVGTSLYVFFKVFPTVEAIEMLNGVRKAEQIFPYFIMNYLPVGITGLVIAAAMAAAMSSLDSSINAISTVGIVDIYRRHLVKNRDDVHICMLPSS
jgi:SSS family solute:Na+ symporter